MNLEPYVKKKELANHLGFSEKTIERWTKRGCPCFTSPGGEATYQISVVKDWAEKQRRER